MGEDSWTGFYEGPSFSISSPWEKLGLEEKLAGKTLEERSKILMERMMAPTQSLPQELHDYLVELLGNYGLVKDMDSLLSHVNRSRRRYGWKPLDREQLTSQIEISLTGKEEKVVTYKGLAKELQGGAWMTIKEIQGLLKEKIEIEFTADQVRSDLKAYKFGLKRYKGKIVAYVTTKKLGKFEEDYCQPSEPVPEPETPETPEDRSFIFGNTKFEPDKNYPLADIMPCLEEIHPHFTNIHRDIDAYVNSEFGKPNGSKVIELLKTFRGGIKPVSKGTMKDIRSSTGAKLREIEEALTDPESKLRQRYVHSVPEVLDFIPLSKYDDLCEEFQR